MLFQTWTVMVIKLQWTSAIFLPLLLPSSLKTSVFMNTTYTISNQEHVVTVTARLCSCGAWAISLVGLLEGQINHWLVVALLSLSDLKITAELLQSLQAVSCTLTAKVCSSVFCLNIWGSWFSTAEVCHIGRAWWQITCSNQQPEMLTWGLCHFS